MKLIDAAAWTGIWPFTMSRELSLAMLMTELQTEGLHGALISPLNAILAPEPMGANRDLLDAANLVSEEDFLVRVVPILNPDLAGWQRDLAELRADSAVVGVRFLPNYHGYDVDGRLAIAATEAVTKAGLPVCLQVRVIDERAHHPLMLVPGVPVEGIARLAAAVPEASILVSGLFQSELAKIASVPNITVELSSIESSDTLANAIATVGVDRLHLGTHAPLYTPAVGVAKVLAAALSHGDRTLVASANTIRIFTLSV